MRMIDLVGTLYDLDRLKGRVCGSCRHAKRVQFDIDGVECELGHHPLGKDDGCFEWKAS